MNVLSRRTVVAMSGLFPWFARADEVSDARAVATAFRNAAANQRPDEAYDLLSDLFKEKMKVSRSAYAESLRQGRAMVGAMKSVSDISYTYAEGDPNTGYKGKMYMFDYKVVYEKGAYFERLVVIRESGRYRIGGIWSNPAPL